jgi:hypothetical protein
MQISDEQLKTFQDLYKKNFGDEISKENALDQGNKVIRLVETVLKQIAKNQLRNNLQNN